MKQVVLAETASGVFHSWDKRKLSLLLFYLYCSPLLLILVLLSVKRERLAIEKKIIAVKKDSREANQ